MSQSIQIYNGPGAYSSCVQAWKRELNDSVDGRMYSIEDFNSSYTAGFDRGNVALVLLPDGVASQMFEPLMHSAVKIKQAIEHKSAFLGSCASALLTSSTVPDVYNFNPVPIYKHTDEHSRTLDVEWLLSAGHFKTDTCRLYDARVSYIFESINPKDRYYSRILAERKEQPNCDGKISATAILYKPTGLSSRLMTTLHPELSYQDVLSKEFIQNFKETESSHAIVLSEEMQNSENVRKEMCRSWFSELGLQINHV